MNRTVCVCDEIPLGRFSKAREPRIIFMYLYNHLLHACMCAGVRVCCCMHATQIHFTFLFIFYIKTICTSCAICVVSFDLWPFLFVASVCLRFFTNIEHVTTLQQLACPHSRYLCAHRSVQLPIPIISSYMYMR